MNKLLLLTFWMTLAASSFGQLTSENVLINGVNRHYYQYLPVNFQPSENLPVVFILHGLGGSASDMTGAGFNYIADTARIIVIYPDALPNSFGQTAWNNGTLLSSTADDISLMNYLVDDVILNKNADPTRIYCSGFSMGSIMSYHLACAMNDRFAAIGCMSGTMPTDDIQNCNPAYKTPVIHFHGTADGTVPYNSNPLPSLSLVPETISFWQNVHACDATPDSTGIPNTASDGITVDRFRYLNCTPDGSLELWRMNNADHVYLYQPVNDLTEAVEIWLFFRRFQHNSPAAAAVHELDVTNRFSVSPNPSSGTFNISSLRAFTGEIYDLNGKRLQTIELQAGENSVALDGLDNGTYLLRDTQTGMNERLVIRK